MIGLILSNSPMLGGCPNSAAHSLMASRISSLLMTDCMRLSPNKKATRKLGWLLFFSFKFLVFKFFALDFVAPGLP
jgi:hypothetical protein